MAFMVGDRVMWRSQSAGVWKVKAGDVAGVIPAGHRPVSWGLTAPGNARDHESYIVRVRSGRGARPYWPRVSALQAMPRDPGPVQPEGQPPTATATPPARGFVKSNPE